MSERSNTILTKLKELLGYKSASPNPVGCAEPFKHDAGYATAVAGRMREVVEACGGTVAFAKLLKISNQAVSVYTAIPPRALPGNKMRSRMLKMGLDYEYVMSGKRGESAEDIERKFSGTHPEQNKMLNILASRGFDTHEKLEEFFFLIDQLKDTRESNNG